MLAINLLKTKKCHQCGEAVPIENFASGAPTCRQCVTDGGAVSTAKGRAEWFYPDGPHFTVTDLRELRRRFGHHCMKCGSEEALSVDHIFPIQLGGFNTADNLQLLCRRCNMSKNVYRFENYRPDADSNSVPIPQLEGIACYCDHPYRFRNCPRHRKGDKIEAFKRKNGLC